MSGKGGKSFTERLRERASRSTAQAGQRNRAAFLAARSDIEAALAERWPVRHIWELLVEEGRINFGYVWFAQLVREVIGPKRGAGPRSSSPALAAPAPVEPPAGLVDSPPAPAPSSDPAPAPEPTAGRPKFVHDPSPKREDYL